MNNTTAEAPYSTSRATCIILGACLHMMICGSTYMMGSISPYIASYFQVSIGQAMLLLPILTAFQTVIMAFGAQFIARLNGKTVLAISGTIATMSMTLASFVPRSGFPFFAVCLSGGMGLCIGLSYTTPIRLGWKAMPARSGLISGLIIGGFGVGSLIFTALGTLIVNPDNLSQIASVSTTTGMIVEVFPEEVAMRVPLLLRWVAFGYAILTVLAQILIREHTDATTHQENSTVQNENELAIADDIQMKNSSDLSYEADDWRDEYSDQTTDDHYKRVKPEHTQIRAELMYASGAQTTQTSEFNCSTSSELHSMADKRGKVRSQFEKSNYDLDETSSAFTSDADQESMLGSYDSAELPSQTRPLTVMEAAKTSQFWLIYLMAFLSVFQGYYALNVYKAYGFTQMVLKDDAFLTKVGSIAAVMGALRFAWSAAMDHKYGTFKRVYGTLLTIQMLLGASIEFAAKSRWTFALWICLMLFTEGGHFTIMPNAMLTIYGDSATAIYGIIFSFTGIANMLILFLVPTHLGQDYGTVFKLSAAFCLIALGLLIFGLKEERLQRPVETKVNQEDDREENTDIKQGYVAVRA